MEEILTGNAEGVEVSEGAVRIPVGYRCISTPELDPPADILASKDPYFVDVQQVAQIPAIGEYRNMQSGVVNENYAYFAMRLGADDKGTYIVKYDLGTFAEVGRSESLMLDHAMILPMWMGPMSCMWSTVLRIHGSSPFSMPIPLR